MMMIIFLSTLFIYGVFAVYFSRARFCLRVEHAWALSNSLLPGSHSKQMGTRANSCHLFPSWYFSVMGLKCSWWNFFLLLSSIPRANRDAQCSLISQCVPQNLLSTYVLLQCLLTSPSSWSLVIIQQFKNFSSSTTTKCFSSLWLEGAAGMKLICENN